MKAKTIRIPPGANRSWFWRLVGPFLRFFYTHGRAKSIDDANWLCERGFCVIDIRNVNRPEPYWYDMTLIRQNLLRYSEDFRM